jgi:microcompartment protein CcmK/EutM
MLIGKVIGTVVCTQKDEKLTGAKLQVVLPIHASTLQPEGKPIIAVDSIGAGDHELVLVATGSSARQTQKTKDTPVDAVIMAIIDSLEADGKLTYQKTGG